MNIINTLLLSMAIAPMIFGACAGQQQQQRVPASHALSEMSMAVVLPLEALATVIPNPPGHMAQKMASIKKIAQEDSKLSTSSEEVKKPAQTATRHNPVHKKKSKRKKSSRY